MKKAKIALSSIALLGVVGSIFAFKAAKHYSALPYYTTTVYNTVANATFTNGNVTTTTTAAYRYFTLEKGAKAIVGSRIEHGA
ncbi:hypothetical protein SIO70_00605 [Chitinophaga sancti]|uniref:hypothetical protein n=1 Tax=Chitinophaga sancti TaxID=1004 RepID=UPI002A765775|nr:hypothetical protein [Chitinophaga sancti]WPQ63361.1 hypothetical protein SIO70_00605 [Chitinophaga sancti]